ncbi:putative f-boxlrr-repeat protein, partial [Nicotiana attenuata]
METSSTKPKLLGASITSTSEGIDRISYLPDEILHNILSSLYIFDVVQLSILSKRWNSIFRTMPYLHFDILRFANERVKRVWVRKLAKKFKDFINWVLISQCAANTRLVRFKLCSSDFFDKVAIFRWIRMITKRNVQELVLSFRLGEPFELP